jgi:hypothetical protein
VALDLLSLLIIMIPKTSRDRKSALAGGAFAGATAGMGLTLMMTLMSFASGKDIWYGMKGAAAPFLGERAMQPGFDLPAVWMGLVSHLTVSVIWGVLFAFLFYGLSKAATMLAGVGWGIVVWIGMFYVVLPVAGLSAMAQEAPLVKNIVYHEIFSLLLAGMYLVARTITAPIPTRPDRRFQPRDHAHVH